MQQQQQQRLPSLLSRRPGPGRRRCVHLAAAPGEQDAGGADHGLARAVDDGLVVGPRVLFTGHALSQTGGHGDMRGAGEEVRSAGQAESVGRSRAQVEPAN